MRKFVLTAALALSTTAGGVALAQTPGGPSEIYIYSGDNYTGDSTRLTGDFPTLPFTWGVHAIKLNGQNWRICSGVNYTGTCVNVNQSNPRFAAVGLPSVRSVRRLDKPVAVTPPVAVPVQGQGPGHGQGGPAQGGQGQPAAGQGAHGQGGSGPGGQGQTGAYGQGGGRDHGGVGPSALGQGGYGQGGDRGDRADRGDRGDSNWGDRGADRSGDQRGGWDRDIRRATYACQDGVDLKAFFNDREHTLRLRSDREPPVTLDQVPAQRGFRYQAEGRAFVGRNVWATYTVGRHTVLHCQLR